MTASPSGEKLQVVTSLYTAYRTITGEDSMTKQVYMHACAICVVGPIIAA